MGSPALDALRRRIDEIDNELLRLLEERMRVCREIGELKRRMGLELVDAERERKVLERAGRWAPVFKIIIKACKEEQR